MHSDNFSNSDCLIEYFIDKVENLAGVGVVMVQQQFLACCPQWLGFP